MYSISGRGLCLLLNLIKMSLCAGNKLQKELYISDEYLEGITHFVKLPKETCPEMKHEHKFKFFYFQQKIVSLSSSITHFNIMDVIECSNNAIALEWTPPPPSCVR